MIMTRCALRAPRLPLATGLGDFLHRRIDILDRIV